MNRKSDFRIDEAGEEFQAMLAKVASWGLERPDGRRMDAGETATITRQLLFVKARTYDVKYPAYKARTFIPVSHDVPSGADTWSYWQWDMFGMAKIIANYATDFPRVDVKVKEFTAPVKSLGDSYGYSVQDLRRAMMAPQSAGQLSAKRAAAAVRFIEAAIDDIAAIGLPDAGFSGFINNVNVPVMAAPTGSWATASALQIIGDLNAGGQKVYTQTNGVESCDSAIFPIVEYGIITATPFSTLGDRTIASWFLANSPYVTQIDQWVKLTNQNAGGNGGRAIFYRHDPEVVTLEIPMEFTQYAPQQDHQETRIDCEARIGGVAFYYPLAAVYMDGMS